MRPDPGIILCLPYDVGWQTRIWAGPLHSGRRTAETRAGRGRSAWMVVMHALLRTAYCMVTADRVGSLRRRCLKQGQHLSLPFICMPAASPGILLLSAACGLKKSYPSTASPTITGFATL